MNTTTTGVRGLKLLILGSRIALGIVATLAVALTLIVINLGGAQQINAFAATQSTGDLSHLSAASGLSEDEQEMTEVWCATLTVGNNADSRITYLGYTPAMSPSGGSLDNTAFTYEDVEYTVENLFYQEFAGTVRQVVFEANYQLPDELILRLDDGEFFVSNSLVLGADENIHTWWLDSSLEWTEGQTIEVSMMAPQSQLPVAITPVGDPPISLARDGSIYERDYTTRFHSRPVAGV